MANPEDIFKDFALPPEWAGHDEPEQPEQKPDELANVKAQLADLMRQREEDQLARVAPAQPRIPVVPPRPLPDLTNLPDPLEDKDAFASELVRRTVANEEAKRQFTQVQQAQVQDQTQRVEALWSDFATEYPDYADQRELVEFVARKVVDKAQARGVDTQRYVFVHSDRFKKDVAAEMTRILPKQAAEAQKEEAADRTVGVFGGQESGGAPAGQRKGAVKADLIDELQTIQRRSGFF